jgi:DNA-binding MarR family transcriptional regulator
MSTNSVRWLSPAEQEAWRGYRRMRALLDLQLARDLGRDSGLSEADYDVLSTLSERDSEWRMAALADRLLWSPSRLAHQAGRMETRGLVRRGRSADDGRSSLLSLTAAGRSLLKAAAPLHVASVRRHMIDLLSPQEVTALARITDKILRHLSVDDPGDAVCADEH